MEEAIQTHVDENVLVITINRPEKKNALTQPMYGALSKAFKQLNEDDSLRVGVIQGSQNCFTAGNDLTNFIQSQSPDDMQPVIQFLKDIGGVNKPLLAAIQGYAVGIGSTLLPHCDLVYADKTAVFQLPFVNIGICVEAGNSVLLPKMVGYHKACELLMLGEKFDAAEAQRIGLVNQVVEEVQTHTLKQAKKLAQKPQAALQATKKLMKRSHQEHCQTVSDENDALFSLLHHPETKQIMQSFFKK